MPEPIQPQFSDAEMVDDHILAGRVPGSIERELKRLRAIEERAKHIHEKFSMHPVDRTPAYYAADILGIPRGE